MPFSPSNFFSRGDSQKKSSSSCAAPARPPPPVPVDPETAQITTWFQMADTDHNGSLDYNELHRALKNDATSNFRPETCRLMINMFDKNSNGNIEVDEFIQLWKYLSQWRQTFQYFDTDNNGTIDFSELKSAIQKMGYTLSDCFVEIALRKFDYERMGSIRFDDFIRFCCILNSLTQQFRAVDVNQNGTGEIGYEQFLQMVFLGAL